MGYFKSNSLEVPISLIDVEPHGPLFDRVTIKVMYSGLNRNGSYFNREAVEYLAKSLPNTPLVGSFDRTKGDFKGHEQNIGFDENNKLKMISSTVPYGVVPADTKIWWQWFEEQGQKREYLCCEGLLWTKRFPEIKKRIAAGTSNQSMEIDEDTIKGAWAMDTNSGNKFFYVKESYLLGLCILGEKTEPCFQGASLSKPVNYSISSDDNFNSMLEELKVALNYEISKKLEGNKKMDNIVLDPEVKEEDIITDANFATQEEDEFPFKEDETAEEEIEEEVEEDEEEVEEDKKTFVPEDPAMAEMLLQKKLETAKNVAELEVLEEFLEEQSVQAPIDSVEPEGEMAIEEEEEEIIVEPTTEENPLEVIPKPGLEPQARIEDARERTEEVPEEEEEEEKKIVPDFEAERAKLQGELSEAYSYISKLEMELKPLRELKTRCEMQEKISLIHEFKEIYGEQVETEFAQAVETKTVEEIKSALGLYAFEHRCETTSKKVEEPIVTFAAKEDNRPSFVKALDAALGRK